MRYFSLYGANLKRLNTLNSQVYSAFFPLCSLLLLVLQNKAELFLGGSPLRCLVLWRDLVLSAIRLR